jgi:hypothetical protein
MMAPQMKMHYRSKAYDKIEHKARGMQTTTSALGLLETFFSHFPDVPFLIEVKLSFLLDIGVARLSHSLGSAFINLINTSLDSASSLHMAKLKLSKNP